MQRRQESQQELSKRRNRTSLVFVCFFSFLRPGCVCVGILDAVSVIDIAVEGLGHCILFLYRFDSKKVVLTHAAKK